MELVGIEEREPGQHSRVDPITFGMTLVVATEISHLLAVDQIDRNCLARVIDRDRKPGHASWFHHNLHLGRGCALTRPREQVIQLAGSGMDGQDRGAEVPSLVQHRRFVGGLDGQVETNGAHTTSFHITWAMSGGR